MNFRLLLLFISVLLLNRISVAQDRDYFKDINYSYENPMALDFLSDDTARYNYFFASEFHRSELAANQIKMFVDFLAKGKGLDVLVMERPYIYGILVSEYLETGDVSILDALTSKFWSFDKLDIDGKISHDAKSLFVWLRDYLKATNTKVRVVGVDLDQSRHGALEIWALERLLKSGKVNDLFSGTIEKATRLNLNNEISFSELKSFYKQLNSDYNTNKEVIINKLGTQSIVLERLHRSIQDIIKYKGTFSNDHDHREQVMLRNFKEQVRVDEIVYGQFGAGHIFLSASQNFKGFVTFLQEDIQYRDKSLSIMIQCKSCILGTDNEASNPYPRLPDGNGYTDFEGFWFLKRAGIDHEIVLNEIGALSVVIELAKAPGSVKELSKVFQYLILLQ